ncbi:MAG: sulfite exporter TauE/SafE family protein [Gemmatimonadetes bacterium]|nr:sulfite exporter TauE/SafE family protein [Gemmatimonadota bacterium]
MDLWTLFVLPLGLGLLGFIEPCTVGSSLLFVKYLEGKEAAAKLLETSVFTVTRAVFIGALGALAAFIGSAFLDLQRWFWVLLGSAYIVVGAVYLARKHWALMRVLGPKLNRVRTARRAATLGVIFGLNIPACAAPLLAAVFAASLGTASVAQGFWMMAVFGLALSLPLVAAVFWGWARGWLDRFAGLTQRVPFWTGVVFVLLGTWSVYLGITA